MRALVIVGCAIALAASSAPAQMAADFEGGVNPFSGGTIVADPEDGGNNALYLARGQTVTMALATPAAPGQGISMKVYDYARSAGDMVELDPANPKVALDPLTYILDGEGNRQPATDSRSWGTIYGWNVGVAGTYNWGVSLQNRSFLGANDSYVWTGNFFEGWPQSLGGLYSMYHFGGPRQVGSGGLAVIGETGTVDAPEVPGDGDWCTWTFELLATGDVYLRNDVTPFTDSHVAAGTDSLPGGGTAPPPNETQFDTVYVCGGRLLAGMDGLGEVLIDDVQVVTAIGPPAQLQADFDGDGDVDLDDFVILKNNFGLTPPADGDADGDGDVDLDDFVILKNEFGT